MWHPYYRFTSGNDVPPVVTTYPPPMGGWLDLPTGKRRTRRERDELREELGILPKKVAAIIKQEAKKQAPKLDDADDARTDRLIAQIERTGQQYKAMYADLLREQIRQEMQDDDEAAMLLLM